MTPETDARRRSIRTAFQAFISAASVLLVAIPVAMATLEGAVSPAAYGTLAAVAASITAGATLVTRIMALPAVTTFIDTYAPWLSAYEHPADEA
jgi:hypothetical protein